MLKQQISATGIYRFPLKGPSLIEQLQSQYRKMFKYFSAKKLLLLHSPVTEK